MVFKILLIEDEKFLSKMYQDKFLQTGFKVVLAFSAEEGLLLVKEEKPDLIMLDILLPCQNGIFFLEELRRDSKVASTLVIAFSNYDDPEIKKRAFELQVKEYLIKTNHTPQEIVDIIKSHLK